MIAAARDRSSPPASRALTSINSTTGIVWTRCQAPLCSTASRSTSPPRAEGQARSRELPDRGLRLGFGENSLPLRTSPRREADVAGVGPLLDLGYRLFAPLDEIAVEVGNERGLTFDEVKPMWERAARVEQLLDERRALGMQLARLACGRFQRRAKIVLGGLVSEEQPEEPLDFEQRRRWLAAEPLLQCRMAFRGNGVARGLFSA